jgi:hypothetical protein
MHTACIRTAATNHQPQTPAAKCSYNEAHTRSQASTLVDLDLLPAAAASTCVNTAVAAVTLPEQLLAVSEKMHVASVLLLLLILLVWPHHEALSLLVLVLQQRPEL